MNKTCVQIEFLHIHLLEAGLSHFFIGVSALGNAEHVEVLALQCLADGGLTAGSDTRFFAHIVFLTSIFGGRPWPLSLGVFALETVQLVEVTAFALRPAAGSL